VLSTLEKVRVWPGRKDSSQITDVSEEAGSFMREAHGCVKMRRRDLAGLIAEVTMRWAWKPWQEKKVSRVDCVVPRTQGCGKHLGVWLSGQVREFNCGSMARREGLQWG
jgi:hypothetical protein